MRLVQTLTLIAVAIGGVPVVNAQTVMGTILGTVVDPSGASVSNAEIAVENIGTKLHRAVLTSDRGEYYASEPCQRSSERRHS